MGNGTNDDMTLEILCRNLRDFRAKICGVVVKNVFCKKRPDGCARGSPLEKSGLQFVICHPGSVCAKLDRGLGCRDKSRAKSVT